MPLLLSVAPRRVLALALVASAVAAPVPAQAVAPSAPSSSSGTPATPATAATTTTAPTPATSTLRRGVGCTQTIRDDVLDDWLALHQHPDGRWSADGFVERCTLHDGPACRGAGQAGLDVLTTSLATLAYLGAGRTPERGREKERVTAALAWLVAAQSDQGLLGDGRLADHLWGTLALLEAADATGDEALEAAATRGLTHLAARREADGGWRDAGPDRFAPWDHEVVLTSWAVVVLSLAMEYGYPSDVASIEAGLAFLTERTGPDGLLGSGPTWPACTGAATFARLVAETALDRDPHPDRGDDDDLDGAPRPASRETLERALTSLAAQPLEWDLDTEGRVDLWNWSFTTHALYRGRELDPGPWKSWEKRMIDAIASRQVPEGGARGSWDPAADPWAAVGGRVGSTAVLALCMQAFYRYDRVIGEHF